MADDMIRLCQNVQLQGVALRCNGKAIVCHEKDVARSEKLCAEMPSMTETKAALDDLIKGICDRSGLQKCRAERIGEPAEEKAGSWISRLVGWVRTRIAHHSSIMDAKAARGELPEYPTRPATPRH